MEWKLRALDAEGNPIEPKQEEQPQQEEVKETVQEETQAPVPEEDLVKETTDAVQQQEDVKEQAEEQAKDIVQEKEEVTKPIELDEQSILNYLKERRNVEAESLDVLLNNDKQETQPLPEDVAQFVKYKEETGRSFEDYARLQQDWSAMDELTCCVSITSKKSHTLTLKRLITLLMRSSVLTQTLMKKKTSRKKRLRTKKNYTKLETTLKV
jgi:hypothetical protein